METQSPLLPTPDHALVWREGRLYLLDQRLLPGRAEFLELNSARATATAIRDMVVRGAPAIGIAAAYGVVLAARDRYAQDGKAWRSLIEADLGELAASRPTAVNLFWALDRMTRRLEGLGEGDPAPALLVEALAIHTEDIAANRRMGELGADLIQGPTAVITHCNAGALATGGYGTALGVIRQGFADGKITRVYADETRPWLQGTRLTAWELAQDDIPVTLQADGAAASLMAWGGIGWVIVGSDRIAANGDVANKIGTYMVAVLAKRHNIPFYVAAPLSTVDLNCPNGDQIPIEERDIREVTHVKNIQLAPDDTLVSNYAFDVTPNDLVTAIITEKGVARAPYIESLKAQFQQ